MRTWADSAPVSSSLRHPVTAASASDESSSPSASPPTAALLSFIAQLPRYPRHLYSHTQPTNNSCLPPYTSHSTHNTDAFQLSTTHNSTGRTRTAHDETTTANADRGESSRDNQRADHIASQQQRLAHSEPRTALHSAPLNSERSEAASGCPLLSHRPLLGRVEQFDVRQQQYAVHSALHSESGRGSAYREPAVSLSPLDYLLTQQHQRRQAAKLRREQINWREQMARMEMQSADAATQQHQRRRQQQPVSELSTHSIVAQQRSKHSADRRDSRERVERQAAKLIARKRLVRQQAANQAARQWNMQPAHTSNQQQQSGLTGTGEEAEVSEQQDDDTQQQSGQTETAGSEPVQHGAGEIEAEQTDGSVSSDGNTEQTVAETTQAPTSRPPSQQRAIVQSPSPPPPPSSQPPLLSLAFLLSCLPPSCDAMEWAALCLSHLPLRADQLGRLANFLSAAHSVLHTTLRPYQTTVDQVEHDSGDSHSQQAGDVQSEVDTLTMAWLGGFIVLPPCVLLPLQDSLVSPPQQPPSIRAAVDDGGPESDVGCELSNWCVHSALSRHWRRLCEWRWSRPRLGPSVDQLLHLLHIVSHKVELDVQRQYSAVDGRTVSPLDESASRGRPAQRFASALRSAFNDNRSALSAALSPSHSHSHSHSASDRLAVSFDLFAVVFSCLFALSSFPAYRSAAAVCSSIDRVFGAVLPVSAEESAGEQRLIERRAARAAEIERRAEVARVRTLECLAAERRTLQRLEGRRQREAAILALHPRAAEWSAAAVNGAVIRSLPPHPLPPLPLT